MMKINSQKIKWVKHIVFFIVGAGLFIGLIYFINEESIQKLQEIQWKPFAGAFLVSIGITGTIAFRWGTITNTLAGKKLASWRQYYHYFIQSRVLGFILPKDFTDFGVRIYWLKKSHNSRVSDASVSVFIDRLYDLLAMLILLAGVIPFWLGLFSETATYFFLASLTIICGGILAYNPNFLFFLMQQLLNFLIRFFSVLPFLKKHIPQSIDIPDIKRKIVLRIYSASILKMVFTMLRFVFFAYAVNVIVDPNIIILGTPLGQVGYLFSFTPGGLGIFEAGWFGIFKLAKVSSQLALLFVVGQRIITMVIIIGLAIISQMLNIFINYYTQIDVN